MSQTSFLQGIFPGIRKREPVDGMTRAQAPKFPRTQDQVMVVAAREDCLILRDHSIVAGIGVGSIDDALLSEVELDSKLEAFKGALNRLRFDVQMLIGTRPQNLDGYRARWLGYGDAMTERREMLIAFRTGIIEYVLAIADAMDAAAAQGQVIDVTRLFAGRFGFTPNDLDGLPGEAADVARYLATNEFFALLTQNRRQTHRQGNSTQSAGDSNDIDPVTATAALLANRVGRSIALLDHWERLILARGSFVEEKLQEMQAPVRTYHLLTAYNPRLIVKSVKRGPMEEREFELARAELAGRCAQLTHAIARMALPAWRATQDELLADVRHFYHPAERGMANREARLQRSVAAQMATVRRRRTGAGAREE